MAHRYKRILFPTDFSEMAGAAARNAVAIAAKYDAELHVVSVVDTRYFKKSGFSLGADDSGEPFDLLAHAKARLKKLTLPVRAKQLKVVRKVREGEVASKLAEYAEKKKVDLIVMTSHTRSRLTKFFLGSVADRLLHIAPCPQLLIRAPEGTVKHPVRRDRGFKKILVPIDFSKAAKKGFKRAQDFAREYNAEIHVLHVVEDAALHLLSGDTRKRATAEMRIHAHNLLDELATSVEPGIKVHLAVECGDPARRIAYYAMARMCDLVVIGSHGRGAAGRLLLGSAVDSVVRTVECPVLIERAK